MNHPFHPLFGKDFELVGFHNCWKKECVEVLDGRGVVISIPLAWTDAAGADPFLLYSQGRSHFRFDELLALSDLLDSINLHKDPTTGRRGVK